MTVTVTVTISSSSSIIITGNRRNVTRRYLLSCSRPQIARTSSFLDTLNLYLRSVAQKRNSPELVKLLAGAELLVGRSGKSSQRRAGSVSQYRQE